MKAAAAVVWTVVLNACLQCSAVNVGRAVIDVTGASALYRHSGDQQTVGAKIARYQSNQQQDNWVLPWSTEQKDAPEFDCTTELNVWKYAWSNKKKLWCCQHYSVGCAESTSTTNGTTTGKNTEMLQTSRKAATEIVNITKIYEVDPVTSWPVPNEWACGLICQGRAADGCCSFEGPPSNGGSTPYRNAKGVCYWLPAAEGAIELTKEAKGWRSSKCTAGFGTAKCVGWQEGLCIAKSDEPRIAASHKLATVGMPIWDLVWEEQFDSSSCVQDDIGIWRPSPESWSYEYGYKRGNELQWYGDDNVECKDGKLIITAKRERQGTETPKSWPKDALCKVKGWDNKVQKITNLSCAVCSPPTYPMFYGNPCDVLQQDGSGKPVCDCSESAEYSSSSIITKGKKEFSYGLYEIKAKVDSRTGSWPSWWFVGSADVGWPRNGEIEILDAFQKTVRGSAIHGNGTEDSAGRVMWGAARTTSAEWEAQWHVWQLEWDQQKIVIRLDREELFALDLTAADESNTGTPNPFTDEKKFFMILDLAVDGNSGGNADTSPFPITFSIDYIKAFRRKGVTWR
mmetsp:Transcript_59920/g.106590  ORF Transcript_59920/g.106590 Transcript_59920/m.106590 type:complete len:569 (+) Transcript_59920:84-1790(+)|eukprot:CAMPEP_0197648272 /NCGR_PEP_ID=MMETSP1338-20131121/27652_1 /TAXON_ID=43686 ORGANISM="Pelagodinium beii, Strain RCC1491" /NCGR_SAMPLE_ID=MMETSP1338 /ASSEMBLY_ACC=CAM_ASM_000754 /LENGTH=568 /DNA_ID=CAMNT_0043222243 /DNA_START=87 /DNA_END=1793 /DNA_ORIENTATION=+